MTNTRELADVFPIVLINTDLSTNLPIWFTNSLRQQTPYRMRCLNETGKNPKSNGNHHHEITENSNKRGGLRSPFYSSLLANQKSFRKYRFHNPGIIKSIVDHLFNTDTKNTSRKRNQQLGCCIVVKNGLTMVFGAATHVSTGKRKAVNSFHHSLKGKELFNQKRKKIEEQKRNQKSKSLREYAKLCKREGIVSDRVNLGSSSSSENDNTHESIHKKGTTTSGGTSKEQNPKKKTNPYHLAEMERQRIVTEKEQSQRGKEEVQQQIGEKKKIREQKRQQSMKRTRKGQPIMANAIKSILGKLTSERSAASQR